MANSLDLSTLDLNNWDPLENQRANSDPEVFSATIKRHIKNILKSYTGWYDPMSEIIQNALDAIDKRKHLESFDPKIWIKIDLKNNLLAVTDNGIGFTENQFRYFLAPDVSFKDPTENTRGNKGVGATYLGYGFNYFQIGTKTPEFSYLGLLQNGRSWVEDLKGLVPRPVLSMAQEPLHEVFNDIDRGTTCVLKFVGTNIRPKDLRYVGASTAQQWAVVLRLKTPVGGIYFDYADRSVEYKIACEIEVIDEAGKSDSMILEDCKYLFPHEAIPQCRNIKDIEDAQKKLLDQGKSPDLPATYHKLNGIYGFWDNASLDKYLQDDESEQLSKKYHITCYAFFCYSTAIWDTYNDTTIGLRKGNRILRGGLQMATNSMPQGELSVIPLTRNVAYQHNAHVVVHFKHADPDLGRKGFQPELEDLAKHISSQVVRHLTNRRNHLKQDTGAPPDIVSQTRVYDWITRQVEHESSNPLIIKRQDVFIPTLRPSLTSEPLNEQDVIALFNQLLAGGVIRGLKVMATDQHQQYDGIFRILQNKPFNLLEYDTSTNPLGMPGINLTTELTGPPQIIEYKYSVDALIDEFEQEIKREQDIKLIVAWTLGTKWERRYQIISLLDTDNIQHRPFHGCTHSVHSSVTRAQVFYAVVLDELIEYINNPDAVQEYHKSKYSI